MQQYCVKVTSVNSITHDVLQIVTEKPPQYTFTPGQATEVSINKAGWKDQKRPFTFTRLPGNDYLEFIIKTYPSHQGVTNQLLQLRKDDELIIGDVFGTIHYKGEGIFIAGGAGITPFISIFRDLHSKNELGGNKLIFANRTRADIILEKELGTLLGVNFINILSNEKKTHWYASGQITEDFIKGNSGGLNKLFYICGPPTMMDAVEKQLAHLQIPETSIIKETF